MGICTQIAHFPSLDSLPVPAASRCSPGWFIPCNGMVSGWADAFMGVFASTCLCYRVWKTEAQRYTENCQLGTRSRSYAKEKHSAKAVISNHWAGFPGTVFFSVSESWDSGPHNSLLYLDFPSILSSNTSRTDHLG